MPSRSEPAPAETPSLHGSRGGSSSGLECPYCSKKQSDPPGPGRVKYHSDECAHEARYQQWREASNVYYSNKVVPDPELLDRSRLRNTFNRWLRRHEEISRRYFLSGVSPFLLTLYLESWPISFGDRKDADFAELTRIFELFAAGREQSAKDHALALQGKMALEQPNHADYISLACQDVIVDCGLPVSSSLHAAFECMPRRVIGWHLDDTLRDSLSIAALRMALAQRPASPGLVHHSDRGVQYASADYTQLLKDHHITISMSRKGNPWDNAACESFMKTLKYEEVYRTEYRNLADARARIGEFLERVYNEKRLHSALQYLAPNEFERRSASSQEAA